MSSTNTCHNSQQFNVLAQLTLLAANVAVTQRLILYFLL